VINLADYNAKNSHSYVIFIASDQVLDEVFIVHFIHEIKANFLVVITDHIKDSSEGIAKNILEELRLML